MKKIMIIGAGFMGTGIAQICAQSGYRVHLVDNSEPALQKARTQISHSLHKLFAKGQLAEHPPAILERIHLGQDYGDAAQMHWIIEAVVEDESTKRNLFKNLDRLAAESVPLATNTSSIPITRLAAGLRFPERVLGLHFFGPVPLMGLVEVVRGDKTGTAVFEKGISLVKSLGKKPVGVSRDIPGFVMNRIFSAAFRECLELVDAGVASFKDIDEGMRLGYGWNVGPFEIADNAGIDTFLNVSRSLRSLGEHHLVSDSKILEDLAADGRLGRKTGRGFYSYDADGRKK